jgi:hypothetical protein
MDGSLKALIAAACVVIVSGGGYFAVGEWEAHQRQGALQLQRAEREANTRLTLTFCNQLAAITIPEKPGEPVRTAGHAEDLKKCRDLGRLGSFELHQLELSGLL